MKALPPETVRLLSSSQVIVSVLNVVKELIENSLDAGATSLEVKLENYGLDRIEVRDNGSGIKAADASVMAVRHYTSKISSHEDLERLETYGFRGEALGSICSISEVIITTKTAEDDLSTQYTLDVSGHVVSQKPSHLGQGTTVCALKLFKNLPVRRQFYSNAKKCKEELKKVQDLLMAYAIIKPELRVVLTHNRVVVWQKARVSDHGAALMAVLGSSIGTNLLPVQHRHEQAEISIDGYFPKPDSDLNTTSSSTSEKTFIFVNNRPVQHKDALKLVRQYYANAARGNNESASRRYPILMMNIGVPASSIDVNLTPDKMQVMFQNKDAVLLAVESVLISMYGSYSVGNDSGEAGRPRSAVADEKSPTVPNANHTVPTAPNAEEGAASEMLEGSIVDVKEQDGETSLPGTANTSSSSSSDDWIVNRSFGDSDAAQVSLSADNGGLNSTGGIEGSSEDQTGEISATSWTTGKAFSDPVSGELLEPVTLHLPRAQETEDDGAFKRPANVIVEKMAKPTAYDLISERSVRRPLSAFALFEQDSRASVLQQNPRAGPQDVAAAVKEKWERLGEEDRGRYEERAQKCLESYNKNSKRASAGSPPERVDPQRQKDDPSANRLQGLKRKAPLSNQQTLDDHFSSRPESKKNLARVSRPVRFSIESLRRSLHPERRSQSDTPGLRAVNRLPSHGAWVVSGGRKLLLLNPFRVEEALLFKRLLEDNYLPTASLQPPVELTDGVLGGPEYMDVLLSMEKSSVAPCGQFQFTDARLVANGFQIRLTPGSPPTAQCVELTAMADCMPFYGVTDLKEILTAVKNRNARTVQQCRPLKVTNYLEGEAVRMARQLPLSMSREDVTNILSRMKAEIEGTREVCLHGRPFFHSLLDVPETEQEALKILSNTT
ncbi:PMS1 protein homolog 1 [Trichomycterus rosablanca]|uniref:PMS1 protein homolog 1 n=1 Tax=Trichomycterus rosablanca TaxID=2290929 RepID=UPI002F355FDF